MSTPLPDFDHLRALLGADVSDELLQLALTHPSAVGEGIERTLQSNQRLEFLGDAILGASVAAHLYQARSTLPEGELTLRKIALVKKPTLARAAKRLKLGKQLLLGRGEENSGGRERDAILADVLESLIGALFLEQGFQAAQSFALRALEEEIEVLAGAVAVASAKNLLQEHTQAVGLGTPVYDTTHESGPSHASRFKARVLLQNEVYGEGEGASKKEAESKAARHALEKISVSHPL